MSHVRVKTEYEEDTGYGWSEKKVLYAWHNNSCDVTTFYDGDGNWLFSFSDTQENNLLDAINRLNMPFNKDNTLAEGVQYMEKEDRIKCKL